MLSGCSDRFRTNRGGRSYIATGEDIIIKKAGKHGYLLPRETTSTIFWGKGIAAGKVLKEMNITDIAPVIMEVLGIDFTAPDGVLHPEILECFEGEIPF